MTIQLTTLNSGLRVITESIPEVETAVFGIWVKIGTRHEQAQQNGIAHLLEHMLFKGTPTRSARAIGEQIENVGGYMNAQTGHECTAYYVKVLADDVALAVEILADMLQHSLFDPQELERERSVVLQEIGRYQDTPEDIIFQHFQSTSYPEQALGRPVLGMPATLQALTREHLFDHIARLYGTTEIVLAAAGKVNHEQILEQTLNHFDSLPLASQSLVEPARYVGGEYRQPKSLEQVHLILGLNGLSRHDPDFPAQAVFSAIIGQGTASRLFQEIREKRGLVYGIQSFSDSYQDGGLWGVYAGTGAKEVQELVPVLCDQLTSLADTLSDEELHRAKTLITASLVMSQESVMGRCHRLGTQLLMHDRIIPQAERKQQIQAVDRQGVQRVAHRLLSSLPTLVTLGPLEHLEDYQKVQERLTVNA